jgi:hypothetical protein
MSQKIVSVIRCFSISLTVFLCSCASSLIGEAPQKQFSDQIRSFNVKFDGSLLSSFKVSTVVSTGVAFVGNDQKAYAQVRINDFVTQFESTFENTVLASNKFAGLSKGNDCTIFVQPYETFVVNGGIDMKIKISLVPKSGGTAWVIRLKVDDHATTKFDKTPIKLNALVIEEIANKFGDTAKEAKVL